jgi:stearoyl-CoA desaturase (delta-9 desaturase)
VTPDPTGKRPILWLNVAYILAVPAVVVPVSLWYLVAHGITALEFTVAAAMWWATGLSITAGYHRLFSHRGYQASAPVRAFFAVFGAMAGQNSVIAWASDHRYHHQHTDTPLDPYSAKEGFWYSHVGWILRGSVWGERYDNVPDLRKDPILRWQHDHWLSIAVLGNVLCVLPLALMTDRPMGMILLAGFLRVTVVQHFTFFINSFAHMFGGQPWSPRNSSRDNWFLSFLTFGEGFHNFHHTFDSDYRNGIRWFHWDPSKWLIWSLSRVGLASQLRRTPDWILLRTRYEKQRASLRDRLQVWSEEKRAEWKRRQDEFASGKADLQCALQREMDAAEQRVQERIAELKARSQEWTRAKRALWDAGSRELRAAAELELRELEFALAEARRSAQHAVRRWDRLVREYIDELELPEFALPAPSTP